MVTIDELREFMRGFSGQWIDKDSGANVSVEITERQCTVDDDADVIMFDINFEGGSVSPYVMFCCNAINFKIVYRPLDDTGQYTMTSLVCNDIETLRVLLNASTFAWFTR